MERKTLQTASPSDASAAEAGARQWLGAMSDEDLVERHRYGDEGAFDEIYHRFAPMIYNLCFRMAGHAEQAEDLTQETFLRIHRHLVRFNGRSSLKTWIYRVTLNHCRSKLGRKRYPSVPLAEEADEGGVHLPDTARGPEEQTLAHDAARRVAMALRRVKPKFREAVVLRDIEGLSYDEIAEVLSVRIGTVRSRIARGRDQLRQALEKMPS